MNIILIIIAFLFLLLGVLGSFLPIIPGPLSSWVGLLIIHFTGFIPMNKSFLIVTLIIAIIIWALDYIIPAIGTKQFGGTRYGIIGTSIGLFVGLIVPIPGGIIIGPFVGALLGELLYKSDTKTAITAAFGSFIGFLASTFIKFIVTLIYLVLFLQILWEYRQMIF